MLLNTVYSKPDRYHDEYAEILVSQLFKFVQENTAVKTNMHLKVIYGIQFLSYVSKHDGNHLRAVPLAWSNAMESSFRSDAVNTEGAKT